MKYSKVLFDNIKAEINGEDYVCSKDDKKILAMMLKEINKKCGTRLRFLAEIDAFNINGSGTIMAKYIDKFQSETVRCYLIPQIVSDNVIEGASIILKSYLHFKESDEYISPPNEPDPAHIYVRYDNAFKTLKPKSIKQDLVQLSYNPRDVFYLPLTMKMLSSWKISELEQVFLSYLDNSFVTNELLGLPQFDNNYYPPASYIKRELKFISINCLKYYPSEIVIARLKSFAMVEDEDISSAIKKTLCSLN